MGEPTPIRKRRGRPPQDFLQDPDRFAVALAFALRTLGNSENDAFRSVTALAFGERVTACDVGPRRKQGRGAVPAGCLVTYGLVFQRGGAAGTLAGRATTLRQKGARVWQNPEAAAWLMEMQSAFAVALTVASSAERCVARILELGRLVTKGKLAEARLLPVLSAELPDIFTNDPVQE
jgi:hypothetical protein